MARTRSSLPTISGMLLRRATPERVEQNPVTTASTYSSPARPAAGAISSATMARHCVRSAPTINLLRSYAETSRPLTKPDTTLVMRRTAMNSPAARALSVTS